MEIYNEIIKANRVSKASIQNILNEINTLHGEKKSMTIGVIEKILNDSLFDLNELLGMVVRHIIILDDICLVDICLSFGANPNLYVDSDELGICHILMAGLKYILDRKIYNAFYHLLVSKGSNIHLPPFGMTDTVTSDHKSVHAWLHHHHQKMPQEISLLDIRAKVCLSVLLRDQKIVEWDMSSLEYMMMARKSYWLEIKDRTDEHSLLKRAFKATFPSLFKNMLDDGIRPHYKDIIFFLSHMSIVSHSVILLGDCKEMFMDMVQRGVRLDSYLVDEIGNFDPEFRSLIVDMYQKPLWEKVCSVTNDEYVPDEMGETLLFLGLSGSLPKNKICSTLEEISKISLEKMVNSFKSTNESIMIGKVGRVTDFINGQQTPMCYNSKFIDNHPMEYSDKAMAYYSDKDGKNWCFLSNSFENLINGKKNPISKEELPPEFIDTVKFQKHFLTSFGIPLHNPKTISKILKDLRGNQTLSNDHTDFDISRIETTLSLRGFDEHKMKSMTMWELNERLKRIDIHLHHYIEISEEDQELTLREYSRILSPDLVYILVCKLLIDKFMANSILLLEAFVR